MKEKWKEIIQRAGLQCNEFTTSDATKWLAHYYYANAGHYVQEILTRMVKDGCIQRIRKGHYQVIQSPKANGGATKAKQIFDNPAQGDLFQ